MRKTIASLLLMLPAAPALAGEERHSAGFERLASAATKVAVARVAGAQRHDDERGKFKIVELEVLDAWKGVAPGERVRVLAFDGVAHGADPEAAGKNGSLLAYLVPVPAKPSFRKFGEGLYQPAGGESSLVALDGEDAAEILDAARAASQGPLPADSLVAQMASRSERVRESALASLLARPGAELLPHGSRVAARLTAESSAASQESLIQILAKTGSAEAIGPLLDFALQRRGAEEMIPIAAEALNRLDPAEAVRRIESRAPASEGRHARALSLLGRLDSPDAMRSLLERARAQRQQSEGAALTLEPAPGDPVAALRSGSFEEKKAAAYQLYRWGSSAEKRLVREEAKRVSDPALRRFLEKLLREPFRPFAEL